MSPEAGPGAGNTGPNAGDGSGSDGGSGDGSTGSDDGLTLSRLLTVAGTGPISLLQTLFGLSGEDAEEDVMAIRQNIGILINPFQWLRRRVLFTIFGGLFQIVFGVAESFGRAFGALRTSIASVGTSVSTAISAPIDIIATAASSIGPFIRQATMPLGPFQPFVLSAIWLVIIAAVSYAGVRALRSILDSVPVLASVETFIFG